MAWWWGVIVIAALAALWSRGRGHDRSRVRDRLDRLSRDPAGSSGRAAPAISADAERPRSRGAWLSPEVRRQARLAAGLPGLLERVVVRMLVGQSLESALGQSLREVDRHERAFAFELSRTLQALRLGVPLREGLQTLERRCGCHEVGRMVEIALAAGGERRALAFGWQSYVVSLRTRRAGEIRRRGHRLAWAVLVLAALIVAGRWLVLGAAG